MWQMTFMLGTGLTDRTASQSSAEISPIRTNRCLSQLSSHRRNFDKEYACHHLAQSSPASHDPDPDPNRGVAAYRRLTAAGLLLMYVGVSFPLHSSSASPGSLLSDVLAAGLHPFQSDRSGLRSTLTCPLPGAMANRPWLPLASCTCFIARMAWTVPHGHHCGSDLPEHPGPPAPGGSEVRLAIYIRDPPTSWEPLWSFCSSHKPVIISLYCMPATRHAWSQSQWNAILLSSRLPLLLPHSSARPEHQHPCLASLRLIAPS